MTKEVNDGMVQHRDRLGSELRRGDVQMIAVKTRMDIRVRRSIDLIPFSASLWLFLPQSMYSNSKHIGLALIDDSRRCLVLFLVDPH